MSGRWLQLSRGGGGGGPVTRMLPDAGLTTSKVLLVSWWYTRRTHSHQDMTLISAAATGLDLASTALTPNRALQGAIRAMMARQQ